MKIECKLRRNGGSRIELGGIEYHFEPLKDGAHVAEVENEAHIDRLLEIGEAYRVYHGEDAPEGKPQTVAAAVGLAVNPELKPKEGTFLNGSNSHASQYTIGEATYTLGDIVRKTYEASQLSEDDWNELDEEDRAARIDITLDNMQEAYELSLINKPDETPAAPATPEPAPAEPEAPKAPAKPKTAAKAAAKPAVKKSTKAE